MRDASTGGHVLALCGGVGGAKLALGLDAVLGPRGLTVAVNTGDDFVHLGLHVSPDLDTVLYTLAGLADPERGWGRRDETWNFMAALAAVGGEAWFSLGDRDLAVHVERTRRLGGGEALSAVTADLASRLGVGARIVPMTDDPVRTIVHTAAGALSFQDYFVRHRCEPRVTAIAFAGAAAARPAAALRAVLDDPALAAIVICPSNPYLSIDPILALPGLRAMLGRASAPVVAVSPLVGGRAVKGPTAKIMAELGLAATPQAIADHYGSLLDGLVIDEGDRAAAAGVSLPLLATRTLMRDADDKARLARELLEFAATLAARRDVACQP